MLKDLVYSFDCKNGQSDEIYTHAANLITLMLGDDAGAVFTKQIGGCEGRFYLEEGTGEDCWRSILEKAI